MYDGNYTEEIKVESFWGAISALVLLQVFGYVILQAFLVSVESLFIESPFPNILQLILGLAFIFVFLLFQSISFSKIKNYIRSSTKKPFGLLKEKDELAKFLLTIFFVFLLILIYLGHLPLLKKEENTIAIVIFYLFSWFASYLLSALRKRNTPFMVAKGSNRIGGMIFGLMFFIIALIVQNISVPFNNDIFKQFTWFLGMLGLGIVIMLGCSILMEDRIKE